MVATKTEKWFSLADYLKPRGVYTYASLEEHLEAALADGYTVYLKSVPGFLMVAGHPTLVESGRPWSDGTKWYRTAKDALNRRHGRQ